MTQLNHERSEIEVLLARRQQQYTHAIVKSALALDSNDQWKNCLTLFILGDGEPPAPREFIYPHFKINETVETLDRALVLLKHLTDDSTLYTANEVIELRDGRFSRLGTRGNLGQRVRNGGGWVVSEWPGDQYIFEARREVNPPSTPLIHAGLPAYPDGFVAVEHILGMDLRGGHTWDGGILCFFPDYRAKFDRITLGTGSVATKIKPNKIGLDQLLGLGQ